MSQIQNSKNHDSHTSASSSRTAPKKRVAVFFGGRSPEHDVSVVTGLQVLQSIDNSEYDTFPVYVDPDGAWLVGDVLRKRENYMLKPDMRAQVQDVTLDVRGGKRGGRLIPKKSRFFGQAKAIEFDVAIPAFHGLYGEDGNIQGLFELANVPYAGPRTKSATVFMDKVTTKYMMRALGIPTLPFAVIRRPENGYMVPEEEIRVAMGDIVFPCILKPVHLGSSVGIAKVNTIEEVRACLPAIFEFDGAAMLEPFVENLVEYNVAVSKITGVIKTSAIERPKTSAELLDFKEKYLSGGGGKNGSKLGGAKQAGAQSSEGMLSLTRDINPVLPADTEKNIRHWASLLFDVMDGTGAPRIDFISNGKTGEVWMNEVNPLPGSFGYFLWEAAKQPIYFTDFMSALIEEAIAENTKQILPKDPVPEGARLLKR